MKNTMTIKQARELIKDPDWKKFECYPEFFEDGKNTINCLILSEKMLERLIEEKTLVYCMIENRYVPSWALDSETQKWKI